MADTYEKSYFTDLKFGETDNKFMLLILKKYKNMLYNE